MFEGALSAAGAFVIVSMVVACSSATSSDASAADGGESGSSQPVAIATGQSLALALAIDSSNLYWSMGDEFSSAVVKMPLAGGTPTTLASPGGEVLAIDATNAYFVGPATSSPGPNPLMSVPLAGGTAVTLAAVQGPTGIASDGTWVYWGSPGDSAIMRMPIGGGDAVTLVPGQPTPESVAVDATSVYWCSFGATGTDGFVAKAPREAGR